MPGSTESQMLGRRKLRKGTRSCFECRRRKTRCIFKSPTDSVCSGCHVRGASCFEQGVLQMEKGSLDRRKSLRERVARLEGMLAGSPPPTSMPLDQSILDTVVSAHSIPTVTSAPDDTSVWNQDTRISAPVLSLFGNAVLTSDNGPNEPEPETSSLDGNYLGEFPQPVDPERGGLDSAHHTLAALIPNDSDLSIILHAGGGWWKSWRMMYPEICCDSMNMTVQDYILNATSQRNPVITGNALLCVALSLQHLPWDFDYTSLGSLYGGKGAIQQYISAVNRLVLFNDDFMSSIEGVETILLQSKLCINAGQARKAWLLIRRGFSYAELVGLAGNARTSGMALSGSAIRRDSVLWHLIEVDRQLSLVLGLPFIVVQAIPEPNTGLGTMSSTQYRRRLFHFAESIIDRNLRDSTPSLITAFEQDHALNDIAELMTDNWWDISSLMAHTPDMGDICDRLFTQFWHHQIKCALHLPFMLRSATRSRYQNSREECFTSSREMLRIFHILRGSSCTRFIHHCQLMDFQAFTAAVILVLGLLGYNSTSQKEDAETGSEDWNLIDLAIEDLRKATLEPQNSVGRQSLQALETIMRQARSPSFSESGQQNNSTKIVVPYFGTIFLVAGERYAQNNIGPMATTVIDMNGGQDATRPVSGPIPTGLDNEAPIAFNSFMPYSVNDYSYPPLDVPHLDDSSWPTLGYTDLDQEWYGL